MALSVEDLNDQTKFRQILIISYQDLIQFIFDNIKKKTALTIFFWSVCLIFFAITIRIRINIAGVFPISDIVSYTAFGVIVLPLLSIPVHELLHIIPYYISGAKNIRVGMDLNQYLFYVTAHRYVATPWQFKIVAIIPFLSITILSLFLILYLPGLWKWSFALFLFFHTTMCTGDFALLNFYYQNRDKKIYTWDDADRKEAYFYEKVQ